MDKLIISTVFVLTAILQPFSVKAQQEELSHRDQKNQTTMIDAQTATEVADNYMTFLTEKNLEGILSLYADTATVEDPVGSKVISGMPALRNFYGGAVKMDLKLQRTGPVRLAGNEAAFPFKLWMKINGQSTVTDIIDVFKFNKDGKIISMRAYWGSENREVID